MQTSPDASTVDLTRTVIRLRDDVRFSPQVYGEETFFHIELPATSEFYRVGYVEYAFLSLLDGNTTFCEALAITAQTQGATAFDQQQALTLYEWLLDTEIASFADDVAKPSGGRKDEKKRSAEFMQKLNPFWIRIPFGRPDALLKFLNPLLGWLFSPIATALCVLLMVAAGGRLVMRWDQFEAASSSVFAVDNWLWLLLAWVLLKVVHEMAHGLVCQRYGGRVRETGIMLAFFAPLAYVDVSSSWRFSSRWQRIHVAAAGMFVELVLASVAVFAWTSVSSEVARHLLYNIVVMASVSTLLFNANPLMRFDGYYILSDFLQIPNLYTQSSQAVQQLMQRTLFGQRKTTPQLTGRNLVLVQFYGIAAFCWRMLICSSMLIAASVMFHGAGVALAVAGIVAWFGMPIWNACKHLHQISKASPLRLVRAVVMTTAFAGLVLTVLFGLPVPFSTTAPGVVMLPEGFRVRTDVDGFVAQIHVTDGQLVDGGELLVTLRNDEITNNHRDLELQIQQETIRQQIAMKEHDAGTAAVAANTLASLRDRLEDTLQQQQSLKLYAPTSGHVVAARLSHTMGTFLHEGDDVLVVDDGRSRELRVSVAQEDFALAERCAGDRVPVRIGTRAVMSGTVDRVIPRASRRLFSPSLAATEGGTLPVKAAESEDEDLQLTEQRFEAIVQLDAAEHGLPVGERGYAPLGSLQETLAEHLYDRSAKWIKNQIRSAEQAAR